jgi:hypothetical protein
MIGIRGVLVVAEVAPAVTLVSAAGLLTKSFVALHNVALGFRPENVLVMRATVSVPFSVGIARTHFADDVMKGFASIVPPDADAAAVGEAIVKIVDAPFGKRPFRVHVDPTLDGAEVVNMVSDRVRAELLRRIGLVDVLMPLQLV